MHACIVIHFCGLCVASHGTTFHRPHPCIRRVQLPGVTRQPASPDSSAWPRERLRMLQASGVGHPTSTRTPRHHRRSRLNLDEPRVEARWPWPPIHSATPSSPVDSRSSSPTSHGCPPLVHCGAASEVRVWRRSTTFIDLNGQRWKLIDIRHDVDRVHETWAAVIDGSRDNNSGHLASGVGSASGHPGSASKGTQTLDIYGFGPP